MTAGSVVFVGADVEHRFHDIEEQLVVLVVFGPAEYTHRVDHQRGQPHGAARELTRSVSPLTDSGGPRAVTRELERQLAGAADRVVRKNA